MSNSWTALTLPITTTVDEELAAKIQAELELEKMRDVDDDMPLSVKEFLENGPFRIVDKPGEEEVELIRQFGDETWVF